MVWRNMALLVGICNYERNGMILEYNFVTDRPIIMKCIKHSKKPPENQNQHIVVHKTFTVP